MIKNPQQLEAFYRESNAKEALLPKEAQFDP